MERVTFNEDLGELVDQDGNRYEGKRISNAISIPGAQEDGENSAMGRLRDLMERKDAKAYEMISSPTHDSRQDYDSTPFGTKITVILYKN